MSTLLYLLLLCVSLIAVVRFIKDQKSGNQKKILVIDDDRAFTRLMQINLTKEGFSVLTAATGQKGLALAKKQRPQMIILDEILPDMKGRDVCERIKDDDATRDVPILFLTVKDSPHDIKAEFVSGAIAHLTKPTSHQELLREIRKIIGD